MAAAIPELLGLSISEGVAFALGIAMGPALEPLTREITNKSWSTVISESNGSVSHPLDPAALADIVAESVEALGWGRDEASKTGISQDDFDALFHATQDAPGFGTLLELLRRNLIQTDDFVHGLRKAKFEGRWDSALEALEEVLLSPADLAMMRQQGFVSVDRQHSESSLQGVNAERADLLYEVSGLPPGVETALEMLRRSIINAAEFGQIVREGHTKTKYTDELLALRNRVVGATVYAELYLKNWITKQERDAGGLLTGYDGEAMDLLSLARGRPATVRQSIIGYRRGARVTGIANDEQAYAKRSVEESAIRPEWADIEYQSNLSYPSGFQIRGEAQAGNLTEAETKQILHELGWKDSWADHFAKAWTAPTGTSADTHVAKAKTQLWSALHRSYLAGDADDAIALQKLGTVGVPQAQRDDVLAVWKEERELDRARLTATQLKKAWSKAVINPATGAAWTKDEVLAELHDRGWNAQDANTFLEL